MSQGANRGRTGQDRGCTTPQLYTGTVPLALRKKKRAWTSTSRRSGRQREDSGKDDRGKTGLAGWRCIRCALLATEGLHSAVMSSHVGASGVNGSSRVGGRGAEDASEDNSNNETYTPCLKALRQRSRCADPAGEGRSSGVEQLVRPALPGRKAHKKTCNRRGWREGNQDRDEERQVVEHVGGRERGKQRQRKTQRSETHGDGVQDAHGRGGAENSSSSNSDIQLNSTLEGGEGSDLQRGQTCLRPHGTGFTRTIPANLNPQYPWPTIRSPSSALPQPNTQTRSTPSSRTAAGDLHHHSFNSSREPDPFWVDVRRGAGTGRPSQSHHTHNQTHNPSFSSVERGEEEEEEEEDEEEEEEEEEVDVEDGEEGGSGVMEVLSQTVTSAAVPPCVPFGERRMSKREKNRIKCLRRRQRRRERWRQSQLQESRQVKYTTEHSLCQHISKLLLSHQMFLQWF